MAEDAISFFIDLVERQRECRAAMVCIDLVTAEHVVSRLRSLADMRGALKDVQADLIAYMLIHAADYASAGPSVEQYKEMIAKLQSSLARSAP